MIEVAQPGTLAQQLKTELLAGVRGWENRRPRSRQTGIGASDLGHPCSRYLAYRATGAEKMPTMGDPWPAIVGTSCHEHVFTEAFRSDPDTWELGRGMEIAPGIRGTLDLYHKPSGTVIDFKVLGKDSLDSTRRHGPKKQYIVQLHAYGFGLYRLGYDVRHVCIAAFPRSGFLRDVVVWTQPLSIDDVVENAFVRWYAVAESAPVLKANPQLFNSLAMADGPCAWCPFHSPVLAVNNPEKGCPGVFPK